MRKILTFLFAALMSVGMWADPIVVEWNSSNLPSEGEDVPFTQGGVTITCVGIDLSFGDFYGPGTFTTTLGNFTKIEVTADDWQASGEGWIGKTWTGNAASVSFSGDIMETSSIVFTIEPAPLFRSGYSKVTSGMMTPRP